MAKHKRRPNKVGMMVLFTRSFTVRLSASLPLSMNEPTGISIAKGTYGVLTKRVAPGTGSADKIAEVRVCYGDNETMLVEATRGRDFEIIAERA